MDEEFSHVWLITHTHTHTITHTYNTHTHTEAIVLQNVYFCDINYIFKQISENIDECIENFLLSCIL